MLLLTLHTESLLSVNNAFSIGLRKNGNWIVQGKTALSKCLSPCLMHYAVDQRVTTTKGFQKVCFLGKSPGLRAACPEGLSFKKFPQVSSRQDNLLLNWSIKYI